jgi:glycine cleavage system H protein
MEIEKDLYYTKSHEWVKMEDDTGTVGITDYAQEELGDVAYIDLPEEGETVKKDEELCEIESVKAVSEIFIPLSGEITAVNAALEDAPEMINDDPYDAWIVKIAVENKKEIEELMSAEEYEEYLDSL